MMLLAAFGWQLPKLFVTSAKSAVQASAAFCYSDEKREESLRDDPGLRQKLNAQEQVIREYVQRNPFTGKQATATTYVIPVVVYVVHDGTTAANISDQQINSQITALNNIFDSYGIQFCLATKQNTTPLPGTPTPGIIRMMDADRANHNIDTEESLLKNVAPVLPSDRYLRIWVVNNIVDGNNNFNGIAGYARFPGVGPANLDGIVMHRKAFGDAATCGTCDLFPDNSEGDILAHEVGHYLNLFHTFHGGCAGDTFLTCSNLGDMVCDTPQIATATTGCPTTAPNSCGTPALINNQMDYTNDACRSVFTNGQVSRMMGALLTARSLLISPANLSFTGVQCTSVNTNFTTSNYNPCPLSTTTFTAVAQSGATYQWDFDDNTAIVTGNPVNHTWAISAVGVHNVTLTVTVSGNSYSSTQQVFISNCLLSNPSQANWYFGGNAALNFPGFGSPTAGLNSAMGTQEGCITQSNSSGQLLFYSDGVTVWDRNHAVMAGGPLNGHQSNSQNSISIPMPGNSNLYYIFTLGTSDQGNAQLWYTIFNGTVGTGQLTNVNTAVPLPGTDRLAEQITAVPKCDGNYWLIVHQGNGSRSKFYAYTVTSGGVTPTPVTSSVALDGVFGYMKASPNGKYLAMATRNGNGDTRAALYDFDPATGVITLRSVLPKGSYGCSFSPDSKLLYTSGDLALPASNQPVYQYEVNAPDPAASIVMVTNSIVIGAFDFVSLQLGPDNKVYANGNVGSNIKFLSVINFPNNRSSLANPNACGFSYNGPSVAPNSTRIGLPNMVDARTPAQQPVDFITTITNCRTVKFETASCASSYLWDFGNGQTSTLQNPTHTYATNGSFNVSLNLNGGPVELTRSISVPDQTATATIAGPAKVCPLNGPPIYNYSSSGASGLSYTWTITGGTISGLNNGPSVDVQWTSLPGTVQMTVTNTTGCSSTKTLTVTQECIGNGTCYNCCGIWSQRSNTGPAPREFAAMAYASSCNRVILFGGRTSGSTVTNETWSWNPSNNSWTQLFPAQSPPARAEHGMAYSKGRDKIILFGGYNSSFTDLNDTWQYDCASNTWTPLPTSTTPPPRRAHAMASDGGGGIVINGGAGGLQDTWYLQGMPGLDFWINYNATQPGSRSNHAMAYDGKQMILFGGVDNSNNLVANETWALTFPVWTKVASIGPAPRQRHGMALDTGCGSVVLFGGNTGGSNYVNDTWEWSSTGKGWCQVSVPSSPPVRQDAAMSYDGKGVLIFSGQGTGASLLTDTRRFTCNKPFTYIAGAEDQFQLTPLDPLSNPSVTFQAALGNPSRKEFDETTANRYVMHTFKNLPSNITRAELEICTPPLLPGNDDTLGLAVTPATGAPVWSNLLTTLPPGFAPTSEDTLLRGLPAHAFNLQKASATAPAGIVKACYVLNLCNLPAGINAQQPTNLLPLLNANHLLDVYVENNTVVDYMKLRVWTCPGKKTFGGTTYDDLGQAQSSDDGSGILTLANLGASGNDGASFFLNEADGLSLPLPDGMTALPNNAYLQTRSFGQVGQASNSLVSSLRVTATADDRLNFLPAFTGSTTYHFALYNTVTGATIAGRAGLNGSAVSIPDSTATGGIRFLKDTVALRRVSNGPTRAFHLVELSSTMVARVNGQDVGTGNLLVFTAEANASITSLSSVELTGAGVSSLRVGPFLNVIPSFNSGGSNVFPPSALAQGEATLETSAGNLNVGNLGSSGTSGVIINARLATGIVIRVDGLDSSGATPIGASLQAGTSHILNVQPPPPPRKDLLSVVRVSPVNESFANQFSITANFSELGATSLRVQAFNGATMVAERVNFTGNVQSNAWPIALRHNGPATLGYQLDFPSDTVIAFGPCPSATCNQPIAVTSLRVSPQNPNVTVSHLTETSFLASDLPSLAINGVTTTPFCAGTITLSPPTLPNAALNAAYGQTLTAGGGFPPYVFAITAGALNTGLSLDPMTGVVSGTATSPGSATFTVTATDFNGCTGSQQHTIVVDCPAITINPPTLTPGTMGQPYTQQLTQTGGTGAVTWNISAGALPPGLTLNPTTGLLSGTPTGSGTFNFTAKATDANGCMGTRPYTLTINAGCVGVTVTVNPTTASNGFVGTAYNQSFTATGGAAPYTFTVTSGGLPGGLTLNATTGLLSGTPTAAGTFNFTIQAATANGCLGSRPYTVVINGSGLMFYPLPAPVRFLDTRPGASPNACSQPNAPILAGTARTQPARGFCGVPAGAAAITGNITTVNSGGGYLTLYPSGAQQPLVANSNYGPNEVINNVFTVGLGPADGAFKIFVLNTTDVVVDVTGYYAPPGAGGMYFHPLPSPVRFLETRPGLPAGCIKPGVPLAANSETTYTAPSACTGIPAAARAIVGNATTVSPQTGGFLTLFPADADRPLVASSNYGADQVINGPFSVGLTAAGQFKIYTFAQTHLVVDILGYYSAEAVDANGQGLLFTPLDRPVRMFESRPGEAGCFTPGAPLIGGQTYTQPVRGVCDGLTIPANALGVVGNATTVSPVSGGFLTIWPSTAAQPTVATANYGTNQVINRHFIVGLGNVDGAFKMFSSATTHLVIDLAGYFAP